MMAIDGRLDADIGPLLEAQQAAMFETMADVGTMPYHPHVDGEIVVARPHHVMTDAPVDLLIGTTLDEMRMFLDPKTAELDRERVTKRAARYLAMLGGDTGGAEELVATYDDDPHLPTPGDVWSRIQTDGEMRRPADAIASAHIAAGPTFVYRFDQPLAGPLAHLRACHASDLPYPFGTFEEAGWNDVVTPDARAVSDAMQAAWAAFARSGDPACDEVGAWPAYDLGARPTMILGPNGVVVDDPHGERRKVWEELAPMSDS